MRLGSLRDGLAAAKQCQAEERPRFALARLQRVSPLWTLSVSLAMLAATRLERGVAAASGRLSCAPARILLASAIPRLAARSSGQRLPWPKFCFANFQRESPRCTLTVFRAAFVAAGSECRGCTGRTASLGAIGCAGWTKRIGGADRENILGWAGTITRARRRTFGRTSL